VSLHFQRDSASDAADGRVAAQIPRAVSSPAIADCEAEGELSMVSPEFPTSQRRALRALMHDAGILWYRVLPVLFPDPPA